MPTLLDRVTSRAMRRMAAAPAPVGKLPPAVKQAANSVLRRKGFDGNGRFQRSGQIISMAFDVLKGFGITISDPVTPASFARPEGTLRLDIEYINQDDPFSPVPILNSVLFLQYSQHDSGYEVVGYLS